MRGKLIANHFTRTNNSGGCHVDSTSSDCAGCQQLAPVIDNLKAVFGLEVYYINPSVSASASKTRCCR